MRFDHMEILILVSICCDVVLFLLIGWLFLKFKAIGPARIERLIDELRQSEALAQRLQKLVEEKARLVQNLEERLKREGDGSVSRPAVDRMQVVSLHAKGLDLSAIAERTGLSTGEVEFILSTARAEKGR